MKHKWCLLGTLLLMQFQPILAQESVPIQGTVQVSYVAQEKVKSYHNVSIRVEGPGEAVYKDDVLRNETKNYLMNEDDRIEFLLKPNQDAEVEGVYLNNEKVQGSNMHTYLLYGSDKSQEVVIRFSSLKKEMPDTGVPVTLINYISMIALSTLVILAWKQTREKEKSKHEIIE